MSTQHVHAAAIKFLAVWKEMRPAEETEVREIAPQLGLAVEALFEAAKGNGARADCPVCGSDRPLLKNGRLRHHLGKREKGRQFRDDCPGSGRLPEVTG